MNKTGVGLRPAHISKFLTKPPRSVSWVEVISENYMSWENGFQGISIENLEKVRSHLPVMIHGVSLSLGSPGPASKSHLKRLKELIDRIQPDWISDHVCWTGIDGENLHDLLPLPYTEEAIHVVVDRINQTQDFLGRQILIENISSYIEFEHSEMKEWEFLSEIMKKSDCLSLLDVNNIYVSSVNHGFDPLKYISGIPLHRVRQIHLAGHTTQDGFLIDTHSTPVIEPVWDLFRKVISRTGPIHSMIERDADIPEWAVLEQEVVKISEILENYTHDTFAPRFAAAV
jgi:uncharacterized protein (UPF0276 family)